MGKVRSGLIAAVATIVTIGSISLAGCASQSASPAKSSEAKTTSTSEAKTKDAISITDVVNHTVNFKKLPSRIILGESRAAYTLAFLNKQDPLKGVVAWGKDLQKAAPDFYAKLSEKFPKAKQIPTIGSLHKGDLTVENLLKFKPDVVVLTLDMYKAAKAKGMIDKLDKSGLKWIVTDYRRQPVENTEKTVEILGKLTGNEASAQKFLDYYKKHLSDVTAKVKQAGAKKPVTFLWRAAGLIECCATFKKSNFATMITLAGGDNLGDKLLPGDVEEGKLTPEQVLASQPEHVVVSGGAWSAYPPAKGAKTSFVNLGYLTDHATAEKSLRAELKQPGFEALKAGKTGEMYGIYHQFYDSPFNFIAIEAFAKWQYPDKFKDVDLEKQFKEFHKEFMPFDYSGTFFVQLGK